MFEARLSQAAVLKRVIDAVKDLCKEVNLDVSAGGIEMQSMDTSHVCLVSFHLFAACFERFECDAPVTLGVNLENLSRLLKCADADDAVTLKTRGSSEDVMVIVIESEEGARVSTVDMKLMSIDSDHMEVPEPASSVELTLSSTRYQRIMRDLSNFGDTLSISAAASSDADDGVVHFGTTGDVGDIAMDIKPSGDSECVRVTESVDGIFAMRYMNTFAKATPLAPRVQLGLVQDMPVRISYNVRDQFSLTYFLAPKIGDGDGDADD